MFRKLTLAALALCVSAAFLSADSIPLPLRMAGINWTGTEATADTPLRFVFTNDTVTMYNRDGVTVGLWEQDRDLVTMRFFDGRIVYTGTVRGQLCVYEPSIILNADDFYVFHVGVRCQPALMTGTARDAVGATWNWSVTTGLLPLQVSGFHDGTAFDFPIPLDSEGVGAGEAILDRNNPWPGRLSWDLRLMQP